MAANAFKGEIWVGPISKYFVMMKSKYVPNFMLVS